MKTSKGPHIYLKMIYIFQDYLNQNSDPNIKRLPKKLLYRFISRLICLILTNIFKLPELVSLTISEFICAFKRCKSFKKNLNNLDFFPFKRLIKYGKDSSRKHSKG